MTVLDFIKEDLKLGYFTEEEIKKINTQLKRVFKNNNQHWKKMLDDEYENYEIINQIYDEILNY